MPVRVGLPVRLPRAEDVDPRTRHGEDARLADAASGREVVEPEDAVRPAEATASLSSRRQSSASCVPSGSSTSVYAPIRSPPTLLAQIELPVLYVASVLARTRAGSRRRRQARLPLAPARLLNGDLAHEVLAPEHLIHHAAHEVHILVADLHEDAAGLGEQLAGRRPAGRAGRRGTSGCPAPRCRGRP